MNTIQQLHQQPEEDSRFTRRPSYGLDEPWDVRLDFPNDQIKQFNNVQPCPFDEPQNGDYWPSIAKLSATGRAEAREDEEAKDRDSPRQLYRGNCIQGSTSNSSKSTIQRSPENSYMGSSNLKDSHFETFEIEMNMPCDYSTTELLAKLHIRSIQGIPSIRDLLHREETDFGETKQGSSEEESEYVELKPRRRKYHSSSKVTAKRMPLLQRVDDFRLRLNCISNIVNEMEKKLECSEGGDMDYQIYKARPAAAVEQNIGKPRRFAARTKMPDDLIARSPVEEMAIEPWENQAFKENDWEEWNDLPYTGWQQQQQSVQEESWGEYKKSGAGYMGKEEQSSSAPPTQPAETQTTSRSAATSATTSTETKQEINSLTHDDCWDFPEENASLPEGSQSSSRCLLSVPSSLKFKHRVRALLLQCSHKHTEEQDDYDDIPSGDESLAGTNLEDDDDTLRGIAFLEEEFL
jgi:hypothetical protein